MGWPWAHTYRVVPQSSKALSRLFLRREICCTHAQRCPSIAEAGESQLSKYIAIKPVGKGSKEMPRQVQERVRAAATVPGTVEPTCNTYGPTWKEFAYSCTELSVPDTWSSMQMHIQTSPSRPSFMLGDLPVHSLPTCPIIGRFPLL
jgi:hypothetical protein